jgi:hypothetical protein
VVAVLGGTIVVYAFLYPVGFALVQTHAFRESIGDPPRAAYKPVIFAASDGLELSGWYRASQNGAAIILDVDPDRIGAFGLSTGANVLIEVAAEHEGLNAVVADGAGMRSCDDFLALDGRAVWLGAPVFCTMFAAARVFSGFRPASHRGPRRPHCADAAAPHRRPSRAVRARVQSQLREGRA